MKLVILVLTTNWGQQTDRNRLYDKGKVTSAYKPSGPSAESGLSQFLQHEATRSISTPLGTGC